jgi:hypothetical protein
MRNLPKTIYISQKVAMKTAMFISFNEPDPAGPNNNDYHL